VTTRSYDPFSMRLHRDPEHGLIMGVCAGLAETFGWRVAAVRLAALLALVFFTMETLLLYVVAGLIMPRKRLTYHGAAESRLWRTRSRGRPAP